ncbi:MAG: hypothetical protein K2P64_13915 [Lachnospiraceae bacterium]|nr:hypothetical protein [Lachnospiraceae bacterium]
MRSIKRYISRKWLWIVIGLILTEVAVKSAYATRGYLAYGGEWLTLPLMLMLAETVRSVGGVIRFLFGKEGDYGSDGD